MPVLARMEIAGVAVDRGVLAEMSKEFDERLQTLEAKIHEAAGESSTSALRSSSAGSSSRSSPIRHSGRRRRRSRTRRAPTSSRSSPRSRTGPVPALVLEWRELSKLKGTYVDALPACIAGGRTHPHAVRPGRRRDRTALVERRRTSRTSRSGRRRAAPSAAAFVAPKGRLLVDGRLLADRAPDPRPPFGRRGAHRRLPPRRGHPPRDRREGVRRPARRAVTPDQRRERQDDQLRRPLRHGAVRARGAARRLARRGEGLHRRLLRALPEDPGLPRRDPRKGAGDGRHRDDLRPRPARSRASTTATTPSARTPNAWR